MVATVPPPGSGWRLVAVAIPLPTRVALSRVRETLVAIGGGEVGAAGLSHRAHDGQGQSEEVSGISTTLSLFRCAQACPHNNSDWLALPRAFATLIHQQPYALPSRMCTRVRQLALCPSTHAHTSLSLRSCILTLALNSPQSHHHRLVSCNHTHSWKAVATWKWDAKDDTCGICRMAFDGLLARPCNVPTCNERAIYRPATSVPHTHLQ